MPTKTSSTAVIAARGVKVLSCICNHPAQDELHGHGKRVMNPCSKGGGKSYRCTVCRREREA